MKFNDEELMAMFKSGMNEAFDMLYDRYGNRIYSFALSYLHQRADAEDVVQEVFTRVAKSAPMYQPRGRFKSWIFHIAMNRIRSMASKKFRLVENLTDFSENSNLINDESMTDEKVINQDILEKSLASLPEMQRCAIILREVEGMNSHDISLTLGVSHENVRVLIHRARKNIQSFLREKTGGPGS